MIVGSCRTDCRVLVSGNPCARQLVESSGQQHSSQLSGMSGSWKRRGPWRIARMRVSGHSAPTNDRNLLIRLDLNDVAHSR